MEIHVIIILLCWPSILALNRGNDISELKRANFRDLPLRRQKRASTSPTCHYEYTRYDDYCYYNSRKYGETASYSDAVSICRLEGGDLASIHDSAENAFLMSYANETMIGLSYYSSTFHWSDGSPYSYTDVDPNFVKYGDYLGYCAKLGVKYWENMECGTTEWPFTCKMKPTLYPNTECPDPSTLYTDSGDLYSPGYPLYYHGNGESCQYMIAARNSHLIRITFSFIDLSEAGGYDSIYVYEGLTEGKLLGAFDRSSNGRSYTYTTQTMNRMLIKFTSYPGNIGKWKATFATI